MSDWIVSFIEAVTYPGIFVLMVLEIPIPIIQSEIVMTFSGFTAARGEISFVGAVLAGVAGSQTGSIGLFLVARRVPEARLNDFLDRYGGWLGFDEDKLERAEAFFRRHDAKAVLIGRLFPGIRAFIAIPAGIERMAFWKFFLFNLIGTAFWVTVLTWLGSVLGDNYGLVDRYSSYVTYGLLVAVALYVAYRLAVLAKRRLKSEAPDAT